jgi:integrase
MEKVYGPYPFRGRWRVVIADGPGRDARRTAVTYSSFEEAQDASNKLRSKASELDVEGLLDLYEKHLASNGTKPSTLVTARFRLRGLLKSCLGTPVKDIKTSKAEILYRRYAEGRAPDTHHGALMLAKACFEWGRKRKHISSNPWLDIDPIGRKRRRKAQLRLDEARRLTQHLVGLADTDDGALGVLLALVLGLRAHEVVGIEKRDLDDGGKVLHVAKSKTHAGERPVVLPSMVRDPLLKRAQLRSGKLLPYQRGWVRDNAKRFCRAAGVPEVCAQALRGTNATFAMEAGMAPELVARSLGHTSSAVTKASYALHGAGRSVAVGRIVDRLALPDDVQ